MGNPQKRKGDKAELELARLLANETGWPVRRKLGAGRADDTGDLDGLPDTTCQVKNYTDVLRALREGLACIDAQQTNAGTTFGAVAVRRRGGEWFFALTPRQFCTLLREATNP